MRTKIANLVLFSTDSAVVIDFIDDLLKSAEDKEALLKEIDQPGSYGGLNLTSFAARVGCPDVVRFLIKNNFTLDASMSPHNIFYDALYQDDSFKLGSVEFYHLKRW